MKKYLIVITLFVSGMIWAQNKLPDDGITSEFHKKYMGKGIFSKTFIELRNEKPNKLTRKFKWGDPIYGRLYWDKGLNNYYRENGWKKDRYNDYLYDIRIYINDHLHTVTYASSGERTCAPICLNPTPNDTLKWNEAILPYYFKHLILGENIIKIDIVPVSPYRAQMEPVSSDSISLYVTQKDYENERKRTFKEVSVSSSNDWRTWKVTTDKMNGFIEPMNSSSNQNWRFNIGVVRSSIDNKSNDYSYWVLESNETKVTIEKISSHKWKISNGSDKMYISKTSNSPGVCATWKVSGKAGTFIMEPGSGSSSRCSYAKIIDKMPNTKIEMKMAAIFIVVFQTINQKS